MIQHATREKGQQHLVLQREQSYTVQHKSTNAPTMETAEGTVEEQLQESVDKSQENSLPLVIPDQSRRLFK
jgi:hypothetical protein